jgi:metal-responsive CopG/Arc/MetJ family transcriptional regulator
MPSDKPKILFVMDKELLKRIDDFRFDNRINSRSEAVRQLIESGLESEKPKNKKEITP